MKPGTRWREADRRSSSTSCSTAAGSFDGRPRRASSGGWRARRTSPWTGSAAYARPQDVPRLPRRAAAARGARRPRRRRAPARPAGAARRARFLPALEALPLDGRDAVRGAQPILREIRERVGLPRALGLGYLTLDRDATTLSGGEAQRIRLAAQLGSNLRGVCYVLDEPTIGLHARDNGRLLEALEALRDRGNSLARRRARRRDHPARRPRHRPRARRRPPRRPRRRARHAGRVGARTPTRRPGACSRAPRARAARRSRNGHGVLRVEGATLHNLKARRRRDPARPPRRRDRRLRVPASRRSCAEVLYEGVRAALAGDRRALRALPSRLTGAAPVARALEVDATPVGKTPRSVPATYLKIWDEIRDALARTREARTRGYGPGRFSFNRKEGRCPECQGRGRDPRRDVVPARRRGAVRALRAAGASTTRRSTSPGAASTRPRSCAPDLRGGGGGLRRLPARRALRAAHERRGPRLPDPRPAVDHPLRRRGPAPQARHGARALERERAPPSTCSTSRPSDCTARTSTACSPCSVASSSAATRCW